MSRGSDAAIRHALQIAAKHGFRTVKLKDGDLKFQAELGKQATIVSKTAEQPVTEPHLLDAESDSAHVIEAPMVGFFSFVDPPPILGASIEAGETIGTITALGIVNEITATASGLVDEILVEDGEAVEFGQDLVRLVKES